MATNFFQLESSDANSNYGVPLLTPSVQQSYFSPSTDYIEYIIKSNTSNLLIVNYNFLNYFFPTNGTVTSNAISDIEIDPIPDLNRSGINLGSYSTYYNFYKNQLNTSFSNQNLFIKEISPDRTELKLNFLSIPITLVNDLEIFKIEVSNNLSAYVEEFYLNFGNNNLITANNFDYNDNTLEIIVNLVNPLPSSIIVNSPLWIVTKIADSIGFNIEITPDIVPPTIITNNIKGPNFNLAINDRINNSTDYIDSTQLFSTTLSSSYNQLNSILEEKGIEINIDYSDFSNFIHFSSAITRINNFVYKVGLIEDYTIDLNSINLITGSTSQSYSVSSSKNIIENKINNIITNFDGFEYYMYYTSGSEYSYPKQNSTQPYLLFSPTSSQALIWLGSSNINLSSFSGILSSASLYDDSNKDYLYYTIPKYLTNDTVNNSYNTFIQMIGQFFDNIWVYYKDVTNLYQADNRLDYGISKDLVSQALQSLGVKIYQNNFSSEDLYSAFLGYLSNPNTTGSLPVTSNSGLEYINNYITASYSASIKPLDDVNKEVYKRLYHNLPYLAKTKGTIPGLRALINCFGVPDTVLRISEFGGRDKDTSTYDYFDQQYNYAAEASASSFITTPWELNTVWSASINNFKASSVQFRFKTSDFDTGSNYQLWNLNKGPGTFPSSSLVLRYSGSGLITGSYSGSTVDPYYQHAYLTFYPKTNDVVNTASIYLPFFDHGWWSIMVNKSQDTYTLYAGNKLYYDGYDGNQIGYLSSSSITLANTLWTGSTNSNFLSGSVSIGGTTYNRLTGSFQEIRYWIKTGSVDSFKDYVMNPQSIDYSGEVLYDDYLVFRLPLGGDLYINSSSIHPRITGSWAQTGSFFTSNDAVLTNVTFKPNIETRFLNSPVVGLRGRVTDKIQIVDSIYPTGSVLSQYISIDQKLPISSSESPDVNLLEIAFSPQNEINDDIINSLGYFNIGEYIGDPRQVSSSATSYPDLNTLSYNFFQKYFDTYDVFDYVRLIKYFDNSLFKMIKDFIPARTGLTSGVVIKQHILERNKYPQPQVYDTQYQNLNVYSSSLGLSSSFNYGEDLTYTGSIDTAFISGSTGGTFNQYNTIESYQSYPFIVSGSDFYVTSSDILNYYVISSSNASITTNNPIDNNFAWDYNNGELITYFYGNIKLFASGSNNSGGGNTFTVYLSSSQQGTLVSSNEGSLTFNITSSISCSYGERFSLWIKNLSVPLNILNPQFGLTYINPYSNQTWPQYYTGSTGVSTIIHSTQDEFYNGELPGTEYVITNGELNDANDFKYPTTLEIYYDPTLYLSNITTLYDFLNINTSPNQGEIYLWFDTGSAFTSTLPFNPVLPQ